MSWISTEEFGEYLPHEESTPQEYPILPLPEGIELLNDVSPGQWLTDSLRPWGHLNGEPISWMKVWSLLPEGFASYCRVLHPVIIEPQNETGDNEIIRWSTVASQKGRTVHPLMQFWHIANTRPDYNNPEGGLIPLEGSLTEEECRILANLLQEFTSTPDVCYFAIWAGCGYLHGDQYQHAPQLHTECRDYLLFQGDVASVMSFINTYGWGTSPHIWWPADHAWCVATEIDAFDTYIGGSEECIDAILNHSGLEAFPSSIDAEVSMYADTINV